MKRRARLLSHDETRIEAHGARLRLDTTGRRIPRSFRVGRREDEDRDWAVRTLDRYDPHRVFSNEFLDRLLSVRRFSGR